MRLVQVRGPELGTGGLRDEGALPWECRVVHGCTDGQAALTVSLGLTVHRSDDEGELPAGGGVLLDGGVLSGQVDAAPHTVDDFEVQGRASAGLPDRAVPADPLGLVGLAVVEPVFGVGVGAQPVAVDVYGIGH